MLCRSSVILPHKASEGGARFDRGRAGGTSHWIPCPMLDFAPRFLTELVIVVSCDYVLGGRKPMELVKTDGQICRTGSRLSIAPRMEGS